MTVLWDMKEHGLAFAKTENCFQINKTKLL